ncbi:MAG: hypothetical protein KA604_02350 [Candidatus Saccharimonas sp.]|nr:hypothetical protein [Candidatus Saccharimonas sp.]
MWFWAFASIVLLFSFMALTGAPYVPSKRRELERAFRTLYKLTPDDTLVDIGAGDGIVLRVASRHGARAIGYEINPLLVLIARWLSRDDKRVSVHLANFWHVKLPAGTTIVYTFGEGRDIGRMYNYVEREASRLNKPLTFMSYGFEVPGKTYHTAAHAYYLYRVVPLQGANTSL